MPNLLLLLCSYELMSIQRKLPIECSPFGEKLVFTEEKKGNYCVLRLWKETKGERKKNRKSKPRLWDIQSLFSQSFLISP